LNTEDVESARRKQAAELMCRAAVEGVVIEVAPEEYDGSCPLVVRDRDGDSVIARGQPMFLGAGDETLQVRFCRGMPAAYVSHALRKVADMLDGPHGDDLVWLSTSNHDGATVAIRLEDGDVHFLEPGGTLDECRDDGDLRIAPDREEEAFPDGAGRATQVAALQVD
jgi:hypothetical protein